MFLSSIVVPVDSNPQVYKILLPLAMLLILAKIFSLLLGRINVPQVIGYLLAGLVVGLIYLIPGQMILTEQTDEGISFFAKIGVILIMFSAGVETDIKKVKSVGLPSFIVALIGVITPMLLAFGLARVYDILTNNSLDLHIEGVSIYYTELYYGVILTATSVSITVAVLKEVGQLTSKVGTVLTSASIIDDVLGIIVLSLTISLSGVKNAGGDAKGFTDLASLTLGAMGDVGKNPAMNIFIIILFMAVFFAITIFAGRYIRKLFNWLGKKYPHHIRIVILSLGFCFLWAYLAELFNIADITGAYLMGLVLSSTVSHGYIDHRAETTSNYLFGPIFFGSIAMGLYTSFDAQQFVQFLTFGLLWIVVGLLGKIIGCGGAGLAFRFRFKDSLRIGFGMMARAEVVIVCAQKGVEAGLVSPNIMPFCLLLILVSSFITPICLKALYKGEPRVDGVEARTMPIVQDATNIANAEKSEGVNVENK